MTVADVRAYVEAENARLAAAGEVDDTEIRVDLRWRLAPNLVLVDTPGLLAPPAGSEIADTALARTSEAAERVLLKQLASSPSRLCLCLEDTADWQLSPTCAVVSRADPQLSRTLLVATKLDGKLRQFSMAEDLHRLLNPPTVAAAHPKLLGGPIFTCVPPTRDQSPQALHEAVAREEAAMRKLLVDRLGSDVYSSRIGVHALRAELQPHVDARWAELLHTASQSIDMQLTNLQKMLQAPPEVEGESLDDFVHRFCLAVHQLIKGSIALPPSSHGETLQQEQARRTRGHSAEISGQTASCGGGGGRGGQACLDRPARARRGARRRGRCSRRPPRRPRRARTPRATRRYCGCMRATALWRRSILPRIAGVYAGCEPKEP